MSEHMELYELRDGVEFALNLLDDTRAVLEAEVCASWCEQYTVSIAYDAEHPHEVMQVVPTATTYGLSILAVLADGAERRVGYGLCEGDISREGILEAFEMAKQSTLPEVRQVSLPAPVAPAAATALLYDPQVLTLPEDELTQAALEALEGILSTLQDAGHVRRLTVDGELWSCAEHIVVGNTHGLVAADTTTHLLATLQTRLQATAGQGIGSCATAYWRDFAAYEAGIEAAQYALQTQHGVTVAAGTYPVVFGPLAVAELLENLLLPVLSLDTVATGGSPLAQHFGQQIVSPLLTMTDEGRLPGRFGSRMITGDGLPTGTTPLIAHGRLVGFLADAYHAQALALGSEALVPRNGLRHALDGKSFSTRPGIFPTNVTLTSPEAMPLETLLQTVGTGIYVGRLWDTVTPAGLHTGAFTSLVLGPSFHIRQGRLAEPIVPGTLRLQENVLDLLQRCAGLSTGQQPVALTTRQSLVLAPELYCTQAHFVAS